jgi:hypothetical protein
VLAGWVCLPVGPLFELLCFGAMRPGGELFPYGLRPVYDRLSADWPGVGLRLPTHARLTRRQVPLFASVLAVPAVLFGFMVWIVLAHT